jgi:hypothetical protein
MDKEIKQQIEQFHAKTRQLAEGLKHWLDANGDLLDSKNKTTNQQWHHLYLAQEALFEAADEVGEAEKLNR